MHPMPEFGLRAGQNGTGPDGEHPNLRRWMIFISTHTWAANTTMLSHLVQQQLNAAVRHVVDDGGEAKHANACSGGIPWGTLRTQVV